MTQAEVYQSILKKLSAIPLEDLIEVDGFLSSLKPLKNQKQDEKVKTLMSFAGSWEDMNAADFNDYLEKARKIGESLFNREVEL